MKKIDTAYFFKAQTVQKMIANNKIFPSLPYFQIGKNTSKTSKDIFQSYVSNIFRLNNKDLFIEITTLEEKDWTIIKEIFPLEKRQKNTGYEIYGHNHVGGALSQAFVRVPFDEKRAHFYNYYTSTPYRRRHFAFYLSQEIISFLSTHPMFSEIEKITATILNKKNTASCNLISKLGFEYSGYDESLSYVYDIKK